SVVICRKLPTAINALLEASGDIQPQFVRVRGRSSQPGSMAMVQVTLKPVVESPAGVADLDAALAELDSLDARIDLIARTVEGRKSFSTSLGLEDQAVLHAIARSGGEFDIFMLDTGRHFPETLEVLDASQLRYRQKIRVISPSADETQALV